jgi:hypothetical protein
MPALIQAAAAPCASARTARAAVLTPLHHPVPPPPFPTPWCCFKSWKHQKPSHLNSTATEPMCYLPNRLASHPSTPIYPRSHSSHCLIPSMPVSLSHRASSAAVVHHRRRPNPELLTAVRHRGEDHLAPLSVSKPLRQGFTAGASQQRELWWVCRPVVVVVHCGLAGFRSMARGIGPRVFLFKNNLYILI